MLQELRSLVNLPELVTEVVAFLPDLFTAIVIFIAFHVLFRVTRLPIVAGLRRTDLHEQLVDLLIDKVYRYTLVAFGGVMALDQLGVNVTAALAGIGVAGIALGFAAQDTVANMISGFLIFVDKPFEVGNWVEVDGEFGQVNNITLRTTRIRTNQNTYVVIPNKRIIDSVLENWTKHGEMRIDVPIGIAYKESIVEARKAILPRLEEKLGWIRKDPAPDVVAVELGNSSVNLLVRVWIDDAAHKPKTIHGVIEESKNALDEAGIQIPFPHLQLFVDSVEERVWERAATLLPKSA